MAILAASARKHEVGVRVSMVAQRRNILAMFLRQGLALGAGGVLIALPIAYMAAQGMQSLLFGVNPADLLVYAACALLALILALAGSLRPAIDAARTDPAITIRSL